jgi:hypothetical protein
MQLIGPCRLCDRNFGVVAEIELDGFDEGRPRIGIDHVALPVSLGVTLLVIGGQMTGFRDREVVELVKSGAGRNVREFLMSRTCPACWPDDPDDFPNPSSTDADSDCEEESDDRDDEDSEQEYDDDGDPIQRPVRAIKVEATGQVTVVQVADFKDLARELRIQGGEVDYSYLGQLGVYIYFDGNSSQKQLPLNSYLAVFGGGPVRGDVIVVTDISSDNRRTSHWHDLRNDWIDHRLFEVIAIVNSDNSIRNLVSELPNLDDQD